MVSISIIIYWKWMWYLQLLGKTSISCKFVRVKPSILPQIDSETPPDITKWDCTTHSNWRMSKHELVVQDNSNWQRNDERWGEIHTHTLTNEFNLFLRIYFLTIQKHTHIYMHLSILIMTTSNFNDWQLNDIEFTRHT